MNFKILFALSNAALFANLVHAQPELPTCDAGTDDFVSCTSRRGEEGYFVCVTPPAIDETETAQARHFLRPPHGGRGSRGDDWTPEPRSICVPTDPPTVEDGMAWMENKPYDEDRPEPTFTCGCCDGNCPAQLTCGCECDIYKPDGTIIEGMKVTMTRTNDSDGTTTTANRCVPAAGFYYDESRENPPVCVEDCNAEVTWGRGPGMGGGMMFP